MNCAAVKVTYTVGQDSTPHAITSKNGAARGRSPPPDGRARRGGQLYGSSTPSKYTDQGGVTGH
ncbi:hypothetical protein [Nonomuraea rubra]|uniref:hypothetical protein n=1 Tax=Nonomuraea rubra TaxID=46180 RepID=UPI0031E92F85